MTPQNPLDSGSQKATMPSMGGVGARIQGLREKRDWSQAELARRAGIHRVSLANIERGAKLPSLRSLERLAKALGVPIARLLKGGV